MGVCSGPHISANCNTTQNRSTATMNHANSNSCPDFCMCMTVKSLSYQQCPSSHWWWWWSNTWMHNLPGPAETIRVWLCFPLPPSEVYHIHMFIGLLLTHHVGLRQCGLMDGSPGVHHVQGDKHLLLTRSGADRWGLSWQSVSNEIRLSFTRDHFHIVKQFLMEIICTGVSSILFTELTEY